MNRKCKKIELTVDAMCIYLLYMIPGIILSGLSNDSLLSTARYSHTNCDPITEHRRLSEMEFTINTQ